jgi:signal transduction histidine kinase
MDSGRDADRILAGWAHDVGKPLQLIESYARRLVDEVASNERSHALARSILALSDDALGVVERLMDGARPSGSRRPGARPLRVVLRRVVDVMNGIDRRDRLRIEGSIPVLEIDRADRLYSVLVNLADNALRASAPDGCVKIDASLRTSLPMRCEREELVIDVVDRGVGMSPPVRQRAFEPYFSTWISWRSVGLGLSESRAQTELLGGRIELDSVEGEGTRVAVILPVEMGRSPARCAGVLCSGLTNRTPAERTHRSCRHS